MKTEINILGVSIRLMDATELTQELQRRLSRDDASHIVTVNPEYLIEASRNSEFKKILNGADLATADGAGIIFVAKLLGLKAGMRDRITGVYLTTNLLRVAEERQMRVAVICGDSSITSAESIRSALASQYPRLNVAVLTEKVSPEELADKAPQILFVNFGAPRQDIWIHNNLSLIPSARIAVGVGGTFDFISGTIKRAPVILQKIGLEWAWRLALEPKRIRRIFRAVIVFPYRALTYKSQ